MSGTLSNQFITIRVKRIERRFSSFWLKSVEDVDLSKHCIGCLVGKRNYDIKQESGCTVSLKSNRIWYLCGVTYPYIWENNFHLAFKYSPGQRIVIDRKGVKLVLQNAEEIPITDEYIDWELPQAKDPKFHTCRNWQFANYIAKKIAEDRPTLF